MKKLVLLTLTGLLLMGTNAFAADGDLIVNGNVGVGTTSPGHKLQILSTGSDKAGLVVGAAGTGSAGVYIDASDGDTVGSDYLAIYQTDDLQGHINVPGKSLLIQESGGNVGIGTTNPTNPLTVDGTNYGGDDSAIIAYAHQNKDVFSILPFTQLTYLGTGVYYKNGVWVHDGAGATNALLGISGLAGGTWYASNNSSPSWNVASAVTLWTPAGVLVGASSRERKENFEALNFKDILHRIDQLDITRWNYKTEGAEVKHIGPMAEDFKEVFGVGDSDKNIALIDEAGIALAGVKGLIEKVKAQEEIINGQKDEISALKKELSDIKGVLQKMAIQISSDNKAFVSQNYQRHQ